MRHIGVGDIKGAPDVFLLIVRTRSEDDQAPRQRLPARGHPLFVDPGALTGDGCIHDIVIRVVDHAEDRLSVKHEGDRSHGTPVPENEVGRSVDRIDDKQIALAVFFEERILVVFFAQEAGLRQYLMQRLLKKSLHLLVIGRHKIAVIALLNRRFPDIRSA